MKKILTLFIGVFLGQIASAQTSKISNSEFQLSEKKKAENGTFQFEFLRSNTDPVPISTQLLEQIESIRHKTEVKYIKGSHYRIKILPLDTISAKEFQPLKEEYIIIDKL